MAKNAIDKIFVRYKCYKHLRKLNSDFLWPALVEIQSKI